MTLENQFKAARVIEQGPNLWHGYPVGQMPYTHITKLCEWRTDSQGIIERVFGRNCGESFRRLSVEQAKEALGSGWYSRDECDGRGPLPVSSLLLSVAHWTSKDAL